MLNNLQTNVAKLQPPASDDKDGKDDDKQPDVWVYWGAPDSYPAGNVKCKSIHLPCVPCSCECVF